MKCPKCGADMVLRTAKKGRNAGSRFWGCSAYPNCRAIAPLDEAEAPGGTEEVSRTGRPRAVAPVSLQAREKQPGTQVRFFETLALDADSVRAANENPEARERFAQWSRWRLDYPIGRRPELTEAQRTSLLMCRRYCIRGTPDMCFTVCRECMSPRLPAG